MISSTVFFPVVLAVVIAISPHLNSLAASPASTEPPQDEPATLRYDDILDPEQKNANAMRMTAEAATRSNRTDRAIELARRALQRRPDELEMHKTLAEALDNKLENQVEKDPHIFAECVREWLIVMRNGAGIEKGTNFRGVGGFLDAFYSDEEFYILAKQRLKELTGHTPKPWETNTKYLRRVLPADQATVSGKLLNKSDSTNSTRNSK